MKKQVRPRINPAINMFKGETINNQNWTAPWPPHGFAPGGGAKGALAIFAPDAAVPMAKPEMQLERKLVGGFIGLI